MFILKDKPSDQDGLIDLIAVHGLKGDYLKSWTADNRNWLKDFLPEQVPNARIMSYGYNSMVMFTKSISTYDDFARDLLSRLENKRKSDQVMMQRVIVHNEC